MSEDAGFEGDGGLPPGGAPEQQPCDCGPCPACAEDRQTTSGCTQLLGHDGDHICPAGDEWVQSDAFASPQRKFCGGPCPEPACGKTCTRPFLHTPAHMCPLGHTW